MPKGSVGGLAAAPARPPRPPAVKFEEPGGYSDPAYQANPRTGPTDPENLRRTIEDDVRGYEVPAVPRQARAPKLKELQEAEPGRYRQPAGSPRVVEPPHIRPTPFPPAPPAQTEPEAPAPSPAPPPQPPAAPKAPETAGGIHVGPPPANTGEPLLHNEGGRTISGLTSDQDLLTRQILEQLRNNPQDQRAHLMYQLLCYIKGEPVPRMDRLASLPQEDREFFAAFLDMLSTLPSAMRDSGSPARRTKVLTEMVERLRGQAELTIPTLALCSKVSGFGVYEPMTTRFIAGTDHPVIVYCEVENFLSKLNERQMWETKLSL
jgi:hypothetical protein